MKNILTRIRKTFLPDGEISTTRLYIEFFTALLTIPAVIAVIMLNADNTLLRERMQVVSSAKEICKPEIGDIVIASPKENETVKDKPIKIKISYKTGEYCAVVWSYRMNGSKWSSYDDNLIVFHNPPEGKLKIELRVKSTVTGKVKNLTRNFIYKPTEK